MQNPQKTKRLLKNKPQNQKWILESLMVFIFFWIATKILADFLAMTKIGNLLHFLFLLDCHAKPTPLAMTESVWIAFRFKAIVRFHLLESSLWRKSSRFFDALCHFLAGFLIAPHCVSKTFLRRFRSSNPKIFFLK